MSGDDTERPFRSPSLRERARSVTPARRPIRSRRSHPFRELSREALYDWYRVLLLCLLVVAPRILGLGVDWFAENNPVELVQLVHLALAVLFAAGATALSFVRRDSSTWIFFLLTLVAVFFMDRELDGLWAPSTFFSGHLSNRLLLTALFFLALLSHLPQIAILLPWQYDASYFRFFALGVTGYLGAQLIDGFGNGIGLSHFAKQVTEESLELYFGSFMLFGSLEALLVQRFVRRRVVGIRPRPGLAWESPSRGSRPNDSTGVPLSRR